MCVICSVCSFKNKLILIQNKLASILLHRFDTYIQSTQPVIDSFDAVGKMEKVMAYSSVDDVFEDVCHIFTKERSTL